MPNSPSTSFIPRRGPAKRAQHAVSRQVYIFTLISYILFFATLMAAGGVFFYDRYIDQKLEAEIVALNSAIGSFSESDMEVVRELDMRLRQTHSRLDKSVSVVSIFDALEQATVETVKISDVELVRQDDSQFVLTSTIETDTFDSSLFQRGVYERNQIFSSIDVTDLIIASAGSEEEEETAPTVNFTATLEVPLSAIPFVPGSVVSPVTVDLFEDQITPEVSTSTDEVTADDVVDNQNPL